MKIQYPAWLKTNNTEKNYNPSNYGWDYEGHVQNAKDYKPFTVDPLQARKNKNMSSITEGLELSKPSTSFTGIGKAGITQAKPKAKAVTVPTGKAGIINTEIHPGQHDTASTVLAGISNGVTLGALNRIFKVDQDPTIQKHKLAYFGGDMLGSTLPVGKLAKWIGKPIGNFVGTKLLGKAAPKLVKPVSNIIEGAATGAAFDTSRGVVEGDNAEQLKDRVKQGAIYGVGIDLGLRGLGKGLEKFLNWRNGKAVLQPIINEEVTTATKEVASTKQPLQLKGRLEVKNTALEKATQEYNDAIETIQNHFRTNQLTPEEIAKIKPELGIDLDKLVENIENAKKPDLRAIGEKQRLSVIAGVNDAPSLNTPGLQARKTLEEIALTDTKANAAVKPQDVNFQDFMPKNSNGTEKRSLPITIADSQLVTPELKNLIEKTDINYNPKSNQDTLDFASKAIKNNPEEALKLVKSNAPATAESNAIAQLFIQDMQQKGHYNDAIELIEITSRKATTQGQAIQVLSMWGRMTPEGMLRYVQNTFDKINNEMSIKGVKKAEKLKLTPKMAEDITRRMRTISKLEDGPEKTLEIAKVLADIDEYIPKSAWQKVSTIQAMAQLLNPKTITRNVIGNGIFAGLENISNLFAVPIDTILEKITGQRTTLLPSLTTQIKGGKEGFIQGVREALAGVNVDKTGGKFELGQQGRTFKKDSVLGKLETGMDLGLRVPDKAFSEAARQESLRQQMEIAGVSKPTKGMEEIADQIAKYRTFQDDNGISNGLKKMKDSLNGISSFFTGTKEFGLGDLIMKYSKTPGNILARAIDYSPAGAVKVLREVLAPLSNKTFNQKAFVDGLSRVMTGTGMIALGYGMSKVGIITGKPDKDIDADRLNREIGKTPYSINFNALYRYSKSGNIEDAKPQPGDKFTTWDWAAPTSIMVGIGANIGQNKGNSADLLTTIMDASVSGMNTIFEQPVLTGVQQLTSFGNIPEGLKRTGLGIPSSFTPTLLKQIAQVGDNNARSTYNPNAFQQSIDQVRAKIPGMSKNLLPQITTQGNERTNYESKGLKKFLDIFINPSFSNTYKPNTVTDTVQKIYSDTGNKTQFPRVAPKTITFKDKNKVSHPIDLTPEEYNNYQQELGKRTSKAIEDIVKANPYASSEDYLKLITNRINKINSELQESIFRKRGLL